MRMLHYVYSSERQTGRQTGSRQSDRQSGQSGVSPLALLDDMDVRLEGLPGMAGRSLPVFTVTGSGSNWHQYPISIDQPEGEHIAHTYMNYYTHTHTHTHTHIHTHTL